MLMLYLIMTRNGHISCMSVSYSTPVKKLSLGSQHLGGKVDQSMDGSLKAIEDDQAVLAHLERRTLEKKFVSIGELRDILRRAAALLCRTKKDQCAIVQHLVGIPFTIFTKQSIKLGISLWLGVINESPQMEPRILAVVAENWEKTVRDRVGAFSSKLLYIHPQLTHLYLADPIQTP